MSHITLGALILAGGQNRRMGGSPKALLPNGSGALILDGLRAAFAGFDEKLLSTNTPELAAGTGFAPVPDARPGMGPLAGLAAALSACQSDGLVVAACDMPCFDRGRSRVSGQLCRPGLARLGPAGPRWPPPPALRHLHQTVPPGHSGGPRRRGTPRWAAVPVRRRAGHLPGGDIPARCRGVQREHPERAKRIAPVLTP